MVGWINSPLVTEWAREFQERGYEVHLAGEADPTLPDAELPELAGVHPIEAAGPPGTRGRGMAADLAEIAERVAPDLTHAHSLAFGWMAARAELHPLIVSAWASDVFRVRATAKRRGKTALEEADVVVADSEVLAQAAALLAPDAPKAVIANWGVDEERFAPGDRARSRALVGLPPKGPVVMGIRGLDQSYNPAALLRGFALLKEEAPDALLVLKHPHDEVPVEIGAAIEKLAIEDSVRIAGRVPLDELPDWYRAADVCVSIPSTDSAPRSVWEALATETPVVASDLPWAREWLTDGRDALLVPARPEPVADALASILGQPDLAARLGACGRALVTERATHRAEMERVQEIYERAAALPAG